MNRAEIETELKRITSDLSDEDLHQVLIYSRHFKNNLFLEKPDDFARFYDLISSIIKRPAMYGVQDVEGLYLFIMGIRFTFGLSDIANDFHSKFNDYVNKNYTEDFKSKRTDIDWARLIRFCSSGNNATLELFSRWFEAFLDTYKKQLLKAKE